MYYSIWRYGNGGYGCANDFVRSRIKDPDSPRLSATRLQGLLCGRFLCLPRGRLRPRSRCQGFAARRPEGNADRVKGPLRPRVLLLGFRLPGNRLAPPFRVSRGRLTGALRPPAQGFWRICLRLWGLPSPLRGNWPCVVKSGGLAGPLRPRAFRRKLAYAAFISPSPSDFSQKSPHRLAHRHFPWYRVTRGCSVHTCLPICPLGRKESP